MVQPPLPSVLSDTIFTCIFCHNPKSITVKIDKKDMLGHLQCGVCGQKFTMAVTSLSDPIDVYTDWVDACEEAAKAGQEAERRGAAGGDRDRGGASSDEEERAPRKRKEKEKRRNVEDSDDE
ncbi:transcription elongation factor Elf1 like-domain-containing protein [Mrakia frigida]|uniref:Elf1p n=1 Tax=Mrakia frigida TaxID=29902 RepID=UPI003FCC05FF